MRNKKSMVLGITGNLCCGKTSTAQYFKKYKAKVIDCDALAHNLLSPGSVCYKKIIRCFGRQIMMSDGRIDRKKLAEMVLFSEKKKSKELIRLENILHPFILKEIKKRIKMYRKTPGIRLIVVDAPLIYETGLDRKKNIFDRIVVIKANEKILKKRMRKKYGVNYKTMLKALSYQLPLSKKISKADYVIDNSSDKNNLKNEIKRLYDRITEEFIKK